MTSGAAPQRLFRRSGCHDARFKLRKDNCVQSESTPSVVMVTVEADALCGLLLARRAAESGVIYSLAYGDQPAMICDLADWARAAGFRLPP